MNLEKTADISRIPGYVQSILADDPFLGSIPSITDVSEVSGGVAHRVYSISDGTERYFLKIRGDHFVSIPSISCNPDDIAFEYRALQLLGSVVPEHVPTVHSFSSERHYLVISDVIGDGKKMETALLSESAPENIFFTYGNTLRTIHDATRTITESVRPNNGDALYYQTVLGHRFGYRHHPALDAMTESLSNLPNRQLVLADFAPKNIGIRTDGSLTVFDLETAHQGNVEFDYAYALAHVILHAPNRIMEATAEFMHGYGDTGFDEHLVDTIMKGILLYRLNSVVPYPTPMTVEQKRRLEQTVLQKLDQSGNVITAQFLSDTHI